MKQRKWAQAEGAFRRAITSQPDLAEAYSNLGVLLAGRGKLAQAETTFRQATRRFPRVGQAYFNLGVFLARQGKLAQAEAAYRKAIKYQPGFAKAYYGLGYLQELEEKWARAEEAYQKAIDLRPNYPDAYCNLGYVLKRQGCFREALAAIQRGYRLGVKIPGKRFKGNFALEIKQIKVLIRVDNLLTRYLKGEVKVNADARLNLAFICSRFKRRYATATRLYQESFTADPKLADNPIWANRYDAARAAALAGSGRGKDADKLDDIQRTHHRRQAHTWLRAELAKWTNLLEKRTEKTRPTVKHWMRTWQADADLASVRESCALAGFPEAERKQWQQLWQEVEALRKRATRRK
jgi:tetratricopeptide (TPR) repeat protein